MGDERCGNSWMILGGISVRHLMEHGKGVVVGVVSVGTMQGRCARHQQGHTRNTGGISPPLPEGPEFPSKGSQGDENGWNMQLKQKIY